MSDKGTRENPYTESEYRQFLEDNLKYELDNGTKQIKAAYRDGMGVGVLVGFMLAAVTIAFYILSWSEL